MNLSNKQNLQSNCQNFNSVQMVRAAPYQSEVQSSVQIGLNGMSLSGLHQYPEILPINGTPKALNGGDYGGRFTTKSTDPLFCHTYFDFGGGGGGIRTHGRLSPTSVFKTGAFDHSATPPTSGTIIVPVSILKAKISKLNIAERYRDAFNAAHGPLLWRRSRMK